MSHKHLIAASILFTLSFANYCWAAPTLFASLTNPNGVVVDQTGNVYVQSLSLPAFGGGLFKFDSNGVLKVQNSQLYGKFRFVSDPLQGVIWAQETTGKLYYVDPATLQEQLYVDLRAYLAGTSQPIYNILTKTSVPLFMISPSFGDIAIRQVGTDQVDLFITGLTSSSGGMPFVLRLRFKKETPTSVKIMVTSIPFPSPIVPPPLDAYPYGIAVNNSGKVLTALPDNLSGGITPLFLATFGADFPETGDAPPIFVQPYTNNNNQAFAIGMTASDKNGGFYVATVKNGFGCGAGSAILYFSPSLEHATCIADLSSFGLGNIAPADIALGPNDQFLYITMTSIGEVLRLELPVSINQTLFPWSLFLPVFVKGDGLAR